MKLIATAIALTTVAPIACWPLSAAAQPVDRQARVWAASCMACHGGQAGRPAIGGLDAQALTAALLAFKAGQRPDATVMAQLARGYSDDALRRIAASLAAH